MAQQEIIVFSSDDKALIESINRINKQILQLQQNARGVSDALNKGGSGGVKDQASAFDKFGKSVENSLGNISRFAKGVVGLVGDLGKLGAAMVGGVALGFKTINSGLLDIEKNSKAALQIQFLKKNFGDLSNIVDQASGGLIDYREQLQIIQKGRGIVTPDQLGKITELGTSLGIVSTNFNETTATLQILDTILTGNAKGLKELSPALYDIVRNNEKILKSKDGQINRQALINLLTNKGLEEIKRTAGILESPFKKLMDMSNFIRKQGEDIFGIFGGIAKLIGGIALPLGVGVASFAFGGPVVGILGTVIGATISGALLAGFSKLAMSLSGKDEQKTKEEFTSRMDVIREILGGSFMQLLTGEGKYFLPDEMLKKAGWMNEQGIVSRDLFSFGKDNQGLIQKVAKIVNDIREFLLGFIKAFEINIPILKSNLETFLKTIGAAFNLDTSKNQANQAGQLTGYSIVSVFNKILGLATGAAGVMKFLQDWEKRDPSAIFPSEEIKKKQQEMFDKLINGILNNMQELFNRVNDSVEQMGAAHIQKIQTEMAALQTNQFMVPKESELTSIPPSIRGVAPEGVAGRKERGEITDTSDIILRTLSRISEPTQNAIMIEKLTEISNNTKKIADGNNQRPR